MAGKSTTLSIKIVSDASGATKGFDDASSKVDGFSRGLDKASIASAGVLVGMAGIAKSAFDSASALQQSTGAIESVFGDWALDIEQAAQKGATSVGLAASAYEDSAALIGSQLQTLGFNTGDAVAQTQALIATGSDLAATFGGSTQDAVDALSSALKGERDPIEKYGVALSQASIDAKIASLGLDTSTDAAKRNAGAVATMALVTEQTAGAQGAFAREADTAAGAQARAAAQFENAKAKLGDLLLPIVADAATKFSALTGFLTEHSDVVTKVAGVVALLAVGVIAVNVATKAFAAGQAVATAAQWLFNAAVSANPISLVVIAVAALVAGVVLAYQKFEPFRTVVDAVGRALKTAFETAVTWAQKLWDKIQPIINGIGKIAGAVGGFIGNLFGAGDTAPGNRSGMNAAARYGAAAVPAGALYGAATVSGGGVVGPASPTGLFTAPAGDTYNITINGVLDADDAADQIARLLDRRARFTGRALAAAL